MLTLLGLFFFFSPFPVLRTYRPEGLVECALVELTLIR